MMLRAVARRVQEHEQSSYLPSASKGKDSAAETLGTLYLILLPLVLGAALIEGLWLSRKRPEGYDWKEWATSLGDPTVRRLLAFIPASLATRRCSPGPTTTACSRPTSARSAHALLLFISLSSSITGSIARATPCAGSGTPGLVYHRLNLASPLSAAYRLGFGKFSGATIFFTPMALLGFEPVTILSALFPNLLYQF